MLMAALGGPATAAGQIAASEASPSTAAPPERVPSAVTPEPSPYDRIWSRFTQWYKNDRNPFVQQVLFSGRYQHEFAAVDAARGDLEEWNVRRMRLGPRITLLRTLTLHAEIDVNPQEHDPLYVRVTDAYLQWTRSSRLALTVGKQGVPFTSDGATSSKELLTIDRSNLSNNLWFPQEYLPGVSASGRAAPWVYRAGVYSAGGMNRELGNFRGGYVALGLLGYDLAGPLGAKGATLTGNFVYQHPDRDNTFTRQLERIFSVHFTLEEEGWGLRADIAQGNGYLGQGDMQALMAMSFYNVTSRLQAVGRYTRIDGDPNAIRLGTYESRIVSGSGNEYNELYLGANYYVYGHKLKLQTGVQWADMNDAANDGGEYAGMSWTTGIRVGW